METATLKNSLSALKKHFEGEILDDRYNRLLYATDASAYREIPLVVARPKSTEDIKKLVRYAREQGLTLIPRTAGTSLAGQVVGAGIMVDFSRHMTGILEVNPEERWVRVQPGVVPDVLNKVLKPRGLFFSPETSTSNRCMIGGMIGNNASGARSLIYGTTRDHVLSVKTVLSDGSEAEFGALDPDAFEDKCRGDKLENAIYRKVRELLSNKENQSSIREGFPDSSLIRRNTGYALDILIESRIFDEKKGRKGPAFNFSKLICGSEGTLALVTEAKLNLIPLVELEKGLLCVHTRSLKEAVQGNLVALKHKPAAVELMDKLILDCTRENIEQRKNCFFVQGDPGAILIIEFMDQDMQSIHQIARLVEKDMRAAGLGYHFPLITGEDMSRVWNLRKAGLGVLSNLPGDAKPVSFVEDTSVPVQKLENYLDDFQQLIDRYSLDCVYHAHISVGELHLRPVLNLKDPEQVKLFRKIGEESARLVGKYRGSLSGEHGDGRVRSEFIPLVVGEINYQLMREIKRSWDPGGVFNRGKITDPQPMHEHLRYKPGQATQEPETYFDYSESGGIIHMAEQCNGSGDCRKPALMGGTMCPSYMATREEETTTRARANILREFISTPGQKHPFDHKEIYKVLDLCLSCKGCKSECPSNVDVAKMKAEFLQHYYDRHGIPLRARLIACISRINHLGMLAHGLFNTLVSNSFTSGLFKYLLGFARKRSIPKLYRTSLRKWAGAELGKLNDALPADAGKVNLFVDEFSNYNDVAIGIKCIRLLNRLGYRVTLPGHGVSARTYLSKGLVRTARKIIRQNIESLVDVVGEDAPLVGIEPSGILGFRDEYPDLAGHAYRKAALKLAEQALLLEEFIEREARAGRITPDQFTEEARSIKLHGHCQQKAVASTAPTVAMLSLPVNYEVSEIPSGCCGMAGSFGYEKEHYDLSMKVGELVLFPAVREAGPEELIAAPGTSCRHQIMDGTGKQALHPAEILYAALK